MSRLGLFLLLVLLIVPLVRDCCMTPANAMPCHQPTPENESCASMRQAIAETKITLGFTVSTDCDRLIPHLPDCAATTQARGAIERMTILTIAANDVYLRTHALLI
jgi:hypothetical protein